jgi:hypothetical protein
MKEITDIRDLLKFAKTQLEAYRINGYVIVLCPFPRELTEACLAAVERVAV